MNNTDLEVQEKHEGGSFFSGLMFGAFAGIAGMFLFGTKKGQKTVVQAKKAWSKIEPQVEQELVQTGHRLQKSPKPFLQAFGEIIGYVADKLEESTPKGAKKKR
ncbi:MAG TPA: hypothetical protein VJ246_01090 [Patescibacteria group bacterium]|nr:hypothetical protein [Patescibacteria group bacterium]